MGSCATCMGPNRRAEKYRVNRLTQDSPMRSSITPSELPIRRHKDKVIEQLNQTKRRSQNNLINVLLSSNVRPEPHSSSPSKYQHKMTTSAYYNGDQNESFRRGAPEVTMSMNFNGNRRIQPKFSDENVRYQELGRVFDRNYGESSRSGNDFKPVMQQVNGKSSSTWQHTEAYRSEIKRRNKEPLGDAYALRNSQFSARNTSPLPDNDITFKTSSFSRHIKSNRLLNIPELSEEDAKTPHYVSKLKRQNGEDVLKSGLDSIPSRLQGLPPANLSRYLKDLQ